MSGSVRRQAVLATLPAPFLAVSGTAIAGAQAMITSKDVVDHSLTGVDIANHSLTGADLRAGSLGSDVFSAAALANLRGETGAAGASGAAGAAGASGAQGDTGPAGADGIPGVGVTTTTAAASDVSNYQDLTPIASTTLSAPGDYVIFTTITVHNTGATDDGTSVAGSSAAKTNSAGERQRPRRCDRDRCASRGDQRERPSDRDAEMPERRRHDYDLSHVTMVMQNLG